MKKTYNELPDDMRESDRQEADRMIAIRFEEVKGAKD